MTFSSLLFLFIFMPVSLLMYHLVPARLKMAILLALSLCFYAWGSPRSLILLLLSILFNYAAGLQIDTFLQMGRESMVRISTILTVVVDLAVLCFFKYVTGTLPIGISFYTFSVLSYIFDVYRENARAEQNPVYMAVYVAFFPKVISGPIVRFCDFQEQLYDLRLSRSDLMTGLNLFLMGLFKKVLIADALGKAFGNVTSLTVMAGGTAWLGMIFYSLQLYFDFSGYSDMAIGLSRMLGFRFEKNFNYPYLSTSISEFWRRWHISLGAWFREYVYIPMGGNRCSALMQARNLLTVWVLTGIWHGSTLNFLVWGLYHGAFVMLERFVIKKRLETVPAVVRILITDFLAFIGWVFFFSPSLGGAVHYLGQMVCMDGVGFWNRTTSFLLKENVLLLLAALLLSTPFVKNIHDHLAFRKGGIFRAVSVGIYVLLFFLCVAELVSATYTSFLYFKF